MTDLIHPSPPEIEDKNIPPTTHDLENLKASKHGVDAAFQYASAEAIVIDAETNKRLLRSIDLHILPWLCTLYFLQYLDKGILSYASVMGILTDAHLSTSQFAWLGTIYYFGYLVAAYPHNRIMQRMPQAKWIAICSFLWGAVLCTMPAAVNFAGLMSVRVFMGALEAVVNCGFVLITAKWYKKYEHSSRVGVWAASNGLSTMVGAIVAYGCSRGSTEAHLSFHGWRILALVCGAVTIIFAVAMFFFMAQSPIDAKFFSEEDKTLAVERLRDNGQGVGSQQFKWHQFKEAFTDVRTWLYCLFILSAQIPAAGTSLFASLLYKSLGFNSNTSLLMSIPTGFIQICSNLGFGYLADRTKQRSLVAAACHLINIFFVSLLVGLSAVAPLNVRFGQLISYFVIIGNGSTPYFIVISMISSNTLGYTKKTTTNGIVFTTLAIAFLIGPQTFRDSPYYPQAKDMVIGLWCLSLVILLVLWYINRRENKRRDLAHADGSISYPDGVDFMDLTDKENAKFRYVI